MTLQTSRVCFEQHVACRLKAMYALTLVIMSFHRPGWHRVDSEGMASDHCHANSLSLSLSDPSWCY